MKYYVRTTGKRTFNYDLDYELLIDKEHKPIESFIDQLRYISKDNAVLLEDDLILCRNFQEEIEKAIEEYPDKIINFFTMPTVYYETHESGEFAFNQCTYYPKGMAKVVADQMEFEHELDMTNPSYASLENKALKDLGIKHIHYRPCLVQHLDTSSLIDKRIIPGLRVTPYFKDWLDEKGIKYEEALKHYKELQEKKKEFIKKEEDK